MRKKRYAQLWWKADTHGVNHSQWKLVFRKLINYSPCKCIRCNIYSNLLCCTNIRVSFTSYVRVGENSSSMYKCNMAFAVCIFLAPCLPALASDPPFHRCTHRLSYVSRLPMCYVSKCTHGMCFEGVANFALILQVRLTPRDTCLYPPRMFHSR